MKVLIISPKFHPVIGGGETFVLNSAKQLHDAGYDIHVAVEPHEMRDTSAYPYDVIEIEGLSDNKLDVIQSTAGLFKVIEKLQPDIIHVHGYFALLIVSFCNIHNIPVIASIHSTPVWGERIVGGMGDFEAELQFARSVLDAAKPAILTAANEVYADAAVKIAEGRTEVKTFPYPVDVDYFYKQTDRSMRNDFTLKDTDVLLMTPSRIIERKGIREAVIALSELPENFYLCLPGAVEPLDQAYWDSITSSEEYQKVQSRVIVPKSKLLYEEMPYLYAASDIIVMPSYYEGAPVATVEAMASGKPFVGADSQGINSFIVNGKNGLLVPKKATTELAAAIKLAYDNPSKSAEYASQAKADIEHLSWPAQLKELGEIYSSLIGITNLVDSELASRST